MIDTREPIRFSNLVVTGREPNVFNRYREVLIDAPTLHASILVNVEAQDAEVTRLLSRVAQMWPFINWPAVPTELRTPQQQVEEKTNVR